MTFGRLWAFLAIALPVLASLLASLPTVDLAYHLRAGGLTLDTGLIPASDTFTFTTYGQPWLNQNWGAQVVLAAVHRATGWAGLAILRALLVGALAGLVYAACRRHGVNRRIAAWLTIGSFALASVALGLRPQLFGLVFFALTFLLLAERRERPRLLWLVPIVVVAWANTHGSFFLGPVLVGLAWLEDLHDGHTAATRTLLVAIAAALAPLLNPFGPAVWLYATGLTTNPLVTERISEWQPTTLRTVPGFVFFASAVLVTAFLARRGRTASWPALLAFAVFFGIGAWAVRGIAWWAIGAAVTVAALLGAERGRATLEPLERPRALNTAIAAILVVAGLVLLPIWRPVDPLLGTPAGVVANAPPGLTAAVGDLGRQGDNLFLPQPWGSWFEFVTPSVRVVLDSRVELFPAETWERYEAVATGRPEWRTILDEWGVTLVIANREATGGLLDQLATDPGWREAYSDADGRLYVRADRAP